MLDRRFPTALQIMQSLLLAEREKTPLISSAQIAGWLGANPTFVRKMLKTLSEAGLIGSVMGRNGGFHLARSAADISLCDIYAAAVGDKRLWMARPDLPPICIVSTHFEHYFDDLNNEMDEILRRKLKRYNLEDSLDALLELNNSTGIINSEEYRSNQIKEKSELLHQ